MRKVLLYLVLVTAGCFAQTHVDPSYQIKWPQVTGSGVPVNGVC